MHPDGFPVPQERDFYWKIFVLSFKTLATDKISGTFQSSDRLSQKTQQSKSKKQRSNRSPQLCFNHPKAIA
jgi:hypothetical protein